MASVNSISPQRLLSLPKPIIKENKPNTNLHFHVKGLSGSSINSKISKRRRRNWNIGSSELNVIPVQSSSDPIDQQPQLFEFEGAGGELNGGYSGSALEEEEDYDKLVDRAINATIVLAAGSFAISKLLTIDQDYWHGWTIYEILRYAPLHNWAAYEEALKENPVFAKMVISGVVYSIGDWIAQCYEGKPLFDFDRTRMFRSGLVGFSLHGSLSHYYYQFCEALFPFHDWWVVPVKVAFDQTAWAALWNSIYFVVLGFLRFESPVSIFTELKATFFPMLTAGWKLWPFAHLITYGVVPIEQRLLWVDCVELIWVTILSTLSNEKSEARSSEPSLETNHIPIPITSEDQVKSTESDQL